MDAIKPKHESTISQGLVRVSWQVESRQGTESESEPAGQDTPRQKTTLAKGTCRGGTSSSSVAGKERGKAGQTRPGPDWGTDDNLEGLETQNKEKKKRKRPKISHGRRDIIVRWLSRSRQVETLDEMEEKERMRQVTKRPGRKKKRGIDKEKAKSQKKRK